MTKPIEEHRPNLIVFVVYKDNNSWRGFCSPYDVTCEAESKKEAIKRLEKLVKLYEEGLEKYGYPKHLSIRLLSNSKDRIVFTEVREEIAERIALDIRKKLSQFQARKEKRTFRIKNDLNPSGYYLYPVPL